MAGGEYHNFITAVDAARLDRRCAGAGGDARHAGYLRDLLCLLPSWPRNRVLELAPAYWQETLKQQETQQRLAANVFRRIVLGDHPGLE